MRARPDERDVVDHLQAAGRELAAAARGFLDAADEVISDRIRLLTLLMGGPPSRQSEAPKVERIEVERVDPPGDS